MTKPFSPSKYQQAIFTWIDTGRGSAQVIAVAGAGKSTTLGEGLLCIPESKSVQVFAFNKNTADDFKVRIQELAQRTGRAFRNVRASTFHSVGGNAVARKLGCSIRELTTDGRKLSKLCDGWLGDIERGMYGEFICKLVSYAKGEGIGAIVPDTDDRWYALIRHHDLMLDDEEADEAKAVDLARELLQRSNKAAQNRLIDFDDMLYLPLLWRLRLWQNDWVFVDEAQDSNPVRRAIAKLALRPGGRSVWVGDPKQAIYGFTGASNDAMDIIKREFNCIELPLTVSFRCAQAVVRQAQQIVPYIEASETAPEGKVETLDLVASLKLLDDHDAVLCRNTAPLISLAYTLIARKRGCVVLGREIGAGLIALVKKMNAKTIDALETKLRAYVEREVAKFTASGEEQKAETVGDRVACIQVCIEHLGENERTIPKLISRIDGLFSDSNGVLTLATIHKAKGKEWRRVGVLRPELSPSKWARQEWQIEQENNLMYVRDTRAKEHLIFMTGDIASLKAAR